MNMHVAALSPTVTKFRPFTPSESRADWTDATVSAFAAHLAAGLSYAQAAALIGVSRNAALGKANRLRAAGDDRFTSGMGHRSNGVSLLAPQSTPKPKAKAPYPQRAKTPPRPSSERYRGLPLLHRATHEDSFAPPSLAKSIVEVGYLECRYMSESTCCGHKTPGGSWCSFHQRLVYAPAKSRRAA